MLGIVLDRKYKITAAIAQGGMGSIYRAEHIHLKRKCAIKVVRKDIARDQVSFKRFKLEAEAASKLRHPNIVEIYDFGITDDNLAYIVMELLQGVSLYDLLRRQRYLAPAAALPVFIQICEALAHAHRNKVLHRDLKPPNIMLDRTEQGDPIVKLVDFGIAKMISKKDIEKLTQTGEVFGSPMYMSPEQCMGKRQIDSRSDVYALGCVMYETLIGTAPFRGDNFMQIAYKHISEPPPAFHDIAPGLDIPEPLQTIVLRCLHKDPSGRYSSIEELAGDLRAFGSAASQISTEVTQSKTNDASEHSLAMDKTKTIKVLPLRQQDNPELEPETTDSFPESWLGLWGGALKIVSLTNPASDKYAVGQSGLAVFRFLNINKTVNLKPPTVFFEPEERSLKEWNFSVASASLIEINRHIERARAEGRELDPDERLRFPRAMRLGDFSLVAGAVASYKSTVVSEKLYNRAPGFYEQHVEKKEETHDTGTGLDTTAYFVFVSKIQQNTDSTLQYHIEATRLRQDRTTRSITVMEGSLTRDWASYAEEISKRMRCPWKTIAHDYEI